jgi:hypothetical protein
MQELLALGLAAVAVIVVLQILADKTGLPAAGSACPPGWSPSSKARACSTTPPP